MARNESYWRRRAEEYEREWQERCRSELERDLARYYRESLREIEDDIAALYGRYARDNGLTYSEARRLIRGSEYQSWRMSLKEYVAAAATDSAMLRELNTLAMRSRISRLEKLYSETLMELQRLGERSESAVKDFLTTAYRERYYHGIFDLATVGKLAIPTSKVEPAKLEKVLAARWQGGNYSSRIWGNTAKLSKVLKQTITQGLHRGLSVDKMARAVNKEMNAGYKNAERLVRTELNFVQNRSAAESIEAAGLSEYEFVAVLDHRTTQRCRDLDGSVFLLEEMQQGANAPPMHPRCRSTITASFGEVSKGGTRTARVDGKSIHIPADMKYADYKRVYIDKTVTLKDWTKARNEDKIPEMYRQITTPLTYKPVSEEKYAQLIIPLKKMGVTIMRGGEDVEKHLDLQKAQASTIGVEAVLFREKVSISAILEETHHVRQNRAGMNDDKDSTLRKILNEIDAKEYLLRVANQYGIPREEIEETKIQLEQHQRELREYRERNG